MTAISDIGDPRVIRALAHPLNVRILASLEGRATGVEGVAAALGEPIGTVGYHLRSLAEVGLVERGEGDEYRPRDRARVDGRSPITLDAEGLDEVTEAVARLHEELSAIHGRSEVRVREGAPPVQAGLVTMLFSAQAAGR